MENIQQKKAGHRNFRGNYIDHHIKVIPKRRKRTPTPRRLIRSIRKMPDANNIILENLKEKLASNLSSMQNEVRKVTRISTHKLQPTPRRRTTSKNIHK